MIQYIFLFTIYIFGLIAFVVVCWTLYECGCETGKQKEEIKKLKDRLMRYEE